MLTQLAARPDSGGQKGRRTTVKVNIFPMTVLEHVVITQYSVHIEPINKASFAKNEKAGASKPKIPLDVSLAAFRQVELLLKQSNPKAWCVFNGEAIAYSTASIQDVDMEVISQRPDPFEDYPESSGGGSRGGHRGGGDRSGNRVIAPSKTLKPVEILTEESAKGGFERFKFVIRKVKELSMHSLLMVAQGKSAEDSSSMETANALSALLRYVPSLLYVPHKAEFFSPVSRVPISGGLEIWHGYHQSVKAIMAGHLGVNVDIAVAVFRKGGMSVIDYLLDVAGLNNPNDIARKSPRELLKYLKNVMVVTTHRGDQKQRFKIQGISSTDAASEFFEMGDQRVSVADYFRDHYRMRLNYPNLPLIMKGSKGTKFPIEVLKIMPSQRMASRLNGQQTADMIRATCQKPDERLAQIENGVRDTLQYDANEYLKEFGVKMSSQMMEVPARILPAPQVTFSSTRISGSSGVWNLRDNKIKDAPSLNSCAFVFFVNTSRFEAEEVRSKILDKWGKSGMNISRDLSDCPILITNPGVFSNIRGSIQHAFREASEKFRTRCQMIVCILSKENKRGQFYKEIKRVCLCEAGVASQVMLSMNVLPAHQIKDQYIANVALKANIKLGGASNSIDRVLTQNSAMFVGIDVSHPPPGTKSVPSICAMVASTDSACTKFNTYIRAQDRRVEVVAQAGHLIENAVRDYMRANNQQHPSEIFIFRDGVSQSQFLTVKSVEIQAISESLKKMGCHAKLIVIVVQKRHHLRLFPLSYDDRDRSGNCTPGTIIDTHVTHPYEFNFILQSHAGIKGTSRPIVYHVLHNESKIGSDDLQSLCYNLCFLSERATRSISVVAPSYRAGLAATYARMFIEGDEDYSDTASMISDTPSASILELAEGVERMMYYM